MQSRSTLQTIALISCGVLCALSASTARAGENEPEAPTFFFTASGGYSVYKSAMVQSNDTAVTVAYGFGAYAGSDRNLGILFKRETAKFAFELNKASIGHDVQDVYLRYRWGPIYSSLVIANTTWSVKAPPDADGDGLLDQAADPVDYLDASTTGYGFNAGANIPVSRRSFLYLDVTYATTTLLTESAPNPDSATPAPAGRTITQGPRMELDLGGNLGLTKIFSMTAGFKYRTYQLSVDGTAYAEQHNSTYVGTMVGWFF